MPDWQSSEHDPENCPGCRPVVFNPQDGELLGADHPMQRAADRAWRNALPAQRLAWHRVTCLNSTNPTDRMLAQAIVARLAR